MSNLQKISEIVQQFKNITSGHYLPGNYISDLNDDFMCDELETFRGVVTKSSMSMGFDCIAKPDTYGVETDIDDANISLRFIDMLITNKLYKVQVYKIKRTFGDQEFSFSQVMTPRFKHHCADFEGIFGFKEMCGDFRTNKKILVCPRDRSIEYNELETILSSQPIDKKMFEFLLWLSCHGGYINNLNGLVELNDELSKTIGCEKFIIKELLKLIK